MATFSQGKYFVVSRPTQAPGAEGWVPYAFATWQDKRRTYYQVFTNLGRTFPTKRDAVRFGLFVAANWINNNM
jgi:hypothetical protein